MRSNKGREQIVYYKIKYLFHRIFENDDFMEENRENENRTQTHEDSKNTYRDMNQYKELCKTDFAISFGDFLQNQPGMLYTE